jgi:hypothetical protein
MPAVTRRINRTAVQVACNWAASGGGRVAEVRDPCSRSSARFLCGKALPVVSTVSGCEAGSTGWVSPVSFASVINLAGDH